MSVAWLIISSLLSAAGAWLVYSHYAGKGQFENIEEVKYQIFHSDEDQPPKKADKR